MKNVRMILAAGILAVAPLSLAIAEEAVAPAMEHAEVAPAEAVVHEFMLADGTTTIYAEGTMAYTMDAEGHKTPLADGEYTLADGTVVHVAEGVATGLPTAPIAEEAVPATE